MQQVVVRGTGMTRFGRHLDRTLKDLAAEAVRAALDDAGVDVGAIDAIVCANSLAGLITGQECIRGEVVSFPLGFGSIPIHNVENACASGANALHLAWLMVASGLHQTVLALGVEKANHEDRQRTFAAYKAGFDPDEMPELAPGSGTDRTPLVDRQAQLARDLMERHGLDREALAAIAARSLANAAKNPVAHRRFGATVDDVLAARMVVDPITTLMSSPVSDGAAAAVVTAADEPRPRDVRIAASRLATRPPLSRPDGPSATRTAVSAALRDAGVTPDQVDVAELHDASVAYEVIAWQETGLCPPGHERAWATSGHTEIGGSLPINPSGGLVGRGHALGASGIAQVHELVQQLRGEAGERQVDGARVALAHVGGGVIGWQTAVAAAHVLVKG